MTRSIKRYSDTELAELVREAGQPAFRVKQLLEWLYVHPVATYDEMTNLPASFRTWLTERAPMARLNVFHKAVSHDKTVKYLFELEDGDRVEAVAIPSRGDESRLTVCLSSQVGCAMGCVFCATAQEGFMRNLGAGEMVDEVLAIQDDLGRRVTNIVVMGQGEPFLNSEQVFAALRILNDPKGIAIGARKITVSTCGIIPGIEAFARETRQFTLAVSLHAARQEVRDQLMPIAARHSLIDLKRALLDYVAETNRRVTLECLLIDGVNDSDEDLQALIEFCDGLLCHINFLPLNAVPGSAYRPSPRHVVEKWLLTCGNAHIEATLRDSRGTDIAGACGQLKNTLS